MAGSDDGRRAAPTAPVSPLFHDSEFSHTRDALPREPAPSESVAALSTALLQAQIASPVVPVGAWDEAAEPDRASERLTALVEALHRCAPTDYNEMVRGER